MSTLTVYANADDAHGYAEDTWAKVQDGTAAYKVMNASAADFDAGDASWGGGDFGVMQGFVRWDCSAIPDTDVVSACILSLWLLDDQSAADFTIEARAYTWSTLSASDYRTATQFSALTLLAGVATSGIGAVGAYKAFTSEAAITSWVNRTGYSSLMLCSSTFPGTAPTGKRYTSWQGADYTGTTCDPKMVITHAPVRHTLSLMGAGKL